jgi:membrane-bound lytic murein transglycosylase D
MGATRPRLNGTPGTSALSPTCLDGSLHWPRGSLSLLLLGAALLWLSTASLAAQEEFLSLDEMADAAEQWATENLDDQTLAALGGLDRERVKAFFADVRREFKGEYVLDLGAFKDIARNLLPVLEEYEETAPYAAWLKARLDYFEVADQLKLLVPPPKQEPGKPSKPLPNPSPVLEREVWVKKLGERPIPEAAKPYVTKLKPIFASQKVPPELVWVAEVESSFNPQARSPDGATGLFQLMPATAKRFGLRTWPFDQRLKPEESARAAAQYLQYLHAKFKDWRLALAAYNSGEGTVGRLLERAKDRSFDSIAPRLPAETQLYVPKVEATVLKREGLKLSELKPPLRQG